MTYAALVSLKLSLNQIMMYSDQYSIVQYQRKLIQSLLPKLEYLLQFLQDSSQKSNEKTCSLITRIRDAAYEAQNIADLQCYETEMAIRHHVLEPKNLDLQHIIQEIDAIESDIREQRGSTTEEAMKIEHRLVPNDSQLQNSSRAGSSRPVPMVEIFNHHFRQIKEELMGQQSALAVVSIIGMGGIGKTTLATNIYNDPSVICQFDFRAWVVVSQSYFIRKILLGILDSMKMLSDEMHGKGDTELKISLYQTLKERRYLIIIDDIWDTTVWDEMRLVLPNDNNGSRILLTTRLGNVATYVSSSGPCHHLSLLSRDQSWTLFCAKVFRDEDCPLELQEIGRKISERCGGLALSLVVMGGLLSGINKTQEAWLDVAKNVTSIVTSTRDRCLEILKLSYDYLPQRLKPCFLYIGVFPEDEEISVSKLIKLWVAEGFLEQVQDQKSEAVAEKCLKELVDRSMIFVSKHNYEGKIKTCRIHDFLHDLCVREAKEEKFLCVTTPRYVNIFQETPHNHIRVSIDSKSPDFILPDTISSFSFVRSLLCTGRHNLSSSVFIKFKLLRVLDTIKLAFPNFPSELLELINLRFISFTCQEHIPASISNLRNLQTLIIHQEHSANLPVEIWNMTHLRHVEFIEGSLIYPFGTQLGVDGSPLVLKNLHTLSGIRNLRFTEDVLARIPSIESLKISFDTLDQQAGWSHYEFPNLVNLQQLKTLKIYVYCDLDTLIRWVLMRSKFEFRFPPSLKELTLGGCSISWEDLSVVGSLPNLEVLKLRINSCQGDDWSPNEGDFCRLKLLMLQGLNLVRWNIDQYYDNPFPCLEQLLLRDCEKLEGIPSQMGESSTLMKIELYKCNDSALASAHKIREMQKDMGNDEFQVVVHTTKKSSFSSGLLRPKIRHWMNELGQ